MNKSLRGVSLIAAIMFLALLVNATFNYGFRSKGLNDDPSNRRVTDSQFNTDRGSILASNTPIAQSVAMYLNKPFVIVRNSSHITEGSTVSVNYVSGTSQRIKKMELSRRTLKEGANVVIVDDFLKGGGTLNGMQSLINEFGAHLIGMTVFAEGQFSGQRLVEDCTSLIKVTAEDGVNKKISAQPGNYLAKVFGDQD